MLALAHRPGGARGEIRPAAEARRPERGGLPLPLGEIDRHDGPGGTGDPGRDLPETRRGQRVADLALAEAVGTGGGRREEQQQQER